MSRTPIQDEFTDLPISRQRKYQLRRQKAGLCTVCGEPAVSSSRCLHHLVKSRERLRKQYGRKRRYISMSYLAELAARAKEKGQPAPDMRSLLLARYAKLLRKVAPKKPLARKRARR